jgi:hypothetical protein
MPASTRRFTDSEVLKIVSAVWWLGTYPSYEACLAWGLVCSAPRFYLLRTATFLREHGIPDRSWSKARRKAENKC